VEELNHDQKLLIKALDTLREHFDCVQIFANRHEPTTENGTIEYECGMGNYYARIGHISIWLKKQESDAALNFEIDFDDEDLDEGEE
tara:strand:- start:392 stop:652 length:261 start_codon:yes stop_codon:yes gene_type:complete